MFRTQEQINKVSERTGVSSKLIKELGIMMSRVKLAQENLKEIKKDHNSFTNLSLKSAKQNINKALNYFENDFLKCKLW